MDDGPQWFCVSTIPNGERMAHVELSRAGWEAFVPMIRRPATRPGHDKPGRPERLVPLFRRYGFVRFDTADQHWRAIWRLPGIAALLSSSPCSPTPVPGEAIAIVRAQLGADGCLSPAARHRAVPLAAGTAVRLLAGPLGDLPALCTWSDGQRVRVLLSMLGRSVSVSTRQAAVEAVAV